MILTFFNPNNINLDVNDAFLTDVIDFQIEKLDFIDNRKTSDTMNNCNDFIETEYPAMVNDIDNYGGQMDMIKLSQEDVGYDLKKNVTDLSPLIINNQEMTPSFNRINNEFVNADINEDINFDSNKKRALVDDGEKIHDLKRQKLIYDSTMQENNE